MPSVTPQQLLEVRDRYAANDTIPSIIARTGLERHVVYYCIDGGPDAEGNRLPPLPRRVTRRVPKSTARKALVARLWCVAEQQVQDIETRLNLEQPPDERERASRMLAIMIKTLRELRALDAAGGQQESAREDEKGPDNLDDFRRDLARKMDAIVAERKAPAAGASERQRP